MKSAGFGEVIKLDPDAVAGRWQVDDLSRVLYLRRV